MKPPHVRILCSATLLPALAAAMLCACCSFGADVGANASENLIVYGPVPGLAPSEHYAVRVRPAGANAPWQTPFVFKTACKDFGRFDPKSLGKIDTEGYCANLERLEPFLRELRNGRAGGGGNRQSGWHGDSQSHRPSRALWHEYVHLKDGKAFFTLEKPCLVAVDIDGDDA